MRNLSFEIYSFQGAVRIFYVGSLSKWKFKKWIFNNWTFKKWTFNQWIFKKWTFNNWMFKYWKVSGKTTAKSPEKLLFWTCFVFKNWMFKNWTFSWVFNFWNKTENSPYKRRRRKEKIYYPRYYSDRSGRKNNRANTKCLWRSMNSSPQRLAGWKIA